MVSSGICVLAMLLSTASAARHDVVQQHRASAEAEGKMVPSEINLAFRRAQKSAQARLADLEKAEATASAAKENAASAATTKMSLMEDVQAKTTQQQAQVERSRQAMTDAEKAASKHLNHAGDFEDALAKWNGLSKDVEGMQENVTMMEEAIATTLARMKKHLEALKDELDAKTRERDAAEEDMMGKKGVVLSANKMKDEAAKAASDAEQEAQKAQQELRSLQATFDKAVSKAAKAEAESKEADGVARNAKNDHDDGKRTVDLIQKLRMAVEAFYGAVDEFAYSDAPAGQSEVVKDPQLKAAYEKYNEMATIFAELNKFSPDTYQKVKPSLEEINRNYKESIATKCDPTGELSDKDGEPLPGFEEHCGDGLWSKVGMTRLELP